MPVQRTFTLISPAATTRGESPERSAQHARPMTSKQVRKAYKASTRGPPMSRAESRKQEKAEQERIRKEFEKEKAAAKARSAREKRKEKEQAEREQKKKRGMPLVSVRPSQDTIARFVRGNGSGKKRNSAGRALEDEGGDEGDGRRDASRECEEMSWSRASPPRRTASHGQRELDLISEEDESGLEELLDTISRQQCRTGPRQHEQFDMGDMAEAKPPPPPSASPQQAAHQETMMPPPSEPSSSSSSCLPQKPQTPRIPRISLAPPPRKKPCAPTPSPPLVPQQPPPMSTQAILGNLDDFFPSSSQQARELQDDAPRETRIPPAKPRHPVANQEQKPTTLRPEPVHRSPPPHGPRRFFTSSGSNELVSLAIQRSRRTAALQEIQEQELSQLHSPDDTWALQSLAGSHRPKNTCTSRTPLQKTNPDAGLGNAPATTTADKENVRPEMPSSCSISDSQETEYGGEWVDELPLDLII